VRGKRQLQAMRAVKRTVCLEAVKELFLEIVMMPFLFRRGEFCSGYVERISKKFNEV
jgi:hypothetical protein